MAKSAGTTWLVVVLCVVFASRFWITPATAAPSAVVDKIYALNFGGHLLHFSSATPGTILNDVSITGLQVGESILAIDFRPNTRQLYGLGSTSRLYQINTTTGVATQVGSGPFTPALTGTEFGFDFNPSVDRIRVVGNDDQNLRLNPSTGMVAGVDTPVAFAPTEIYSNAVIVGLAYSNNVMSATVTTLYGYDFYVDRLAMLGGPNGSPSPNGGQLFPIGFSGVATCNKLIGLDISSLGHAYASLNTGTCISPTSGLYSVNLSTGAATLIGAIGGSSEIRDIAVELSYPLFLPLIRR